MMDNNHLSLRLYLQGSLDNINLFSVITVMSFFLLAPVTYLMEGVKFTPAVIQAAVCSLKIHCSLIACKSDRYRICVNYAVRVILCWSLLRSYVS